MAQSRLERIGTIYTRTKSLVRGGAMKPEDTPLWYQIYEAFPPKLEPRFNREVPTTPIRPIFYREDVVRAKFQKDHSKLLSWNLSDNESTTRTRQFLEIYEKMEKGGLTDEQLYSNALEAYRAQSESFQSSAKQAPEEAKASVNEGQHAQSTQIDLKNVFKE